MHRGGPCLMQPAAPPLRLPVSAESRPRDERITAHVAALRSGSTLACVYVVATPSSNRTLRYTEPASFANGSPARLTLSKIDTAVTVACGTHTECCQACGHGWGYPCGVQRYVFISVCMYIFAVVCAGACACVCMFVCARACSVRERTRNRENQWA